MTDEEKLQQQEESSMSFWDHLEVLRWALFRVLIVFAVMLVACFVAMPHIFDEFVLGPTNGNFFVYRLLAGLGHGGGTFVPDFADDFHVDIININVASQFLTHISTSLWFALVLVFPYLIFELWKFLKPALYDYERHGVGGAFLVGTLLFYLGCAVGYCSVFPLTFRFLTTYTVGGSIMNQISLNSYMTNFITIIFVMGVVFEIPILAWILSCMGLVNKDMLREYRRIAIVVLLVLSAVITPSGDPFTLGVVFLPLYLLYEVSILVVRPAVVEDDNE